KNITAEPSLSNWTPGYVDYGENTEHNCLILVELKALAAVCMAISLCGLVGNGLVLWFLDFHGNRSLVSHYIANLAVVDFTLLLVFLLLMLAVLSFSTFCLSDLISSYLNFVFSSAIVCQFFDLNSLGFLAAMSVDQCLALF
ncbi:MRGRD protein, partial [Psilopogon haemacephalus]|nr:MRGRD protein [Psilopogon haemacephalus]